MLTIILYLSKTWRLWIISRKGSAVHPKSPCPPLFLSVQLCCLLLRLLHGPSPCFVWPSTRLQRDLMTFIIRWGNLIWAAPLSEMSSLIRRHAGENKRVSNYSLGVWVGRVQYVGDESARVKKQRERVGAGRGTKRGLWKKSIESPASGYEIWVGIRFLIVTGAMVRVIIHKAARRVSKQKGKLGERKELCARTRERSQISNVWLGSYSVAELLPSTSWQTTSPSQCYTTLMWLANFWNRMRKLLNDLR